ncbi:MAG: ABC transporter substrate-binding protein [Deltaproteobacteria bacterium]|jgi:iron complex transport system substrate-binding protein|nr:ABC transporter substrate-binding protein [Deltaproteobacteria bacterium]
MIAPKLTAIFLSLACLALSACTKEDPGLTLSPLALVEKDGYWLTKDLMDREIALVPKNQPIPDEVTEKFKPTAIVRTPVEKVIVASGTYDPGLIFGLGAGDCIIGTTDPKESWYLPGMQELFKEGKVKFIGLYNAIDLESIVTLKPDLILVSSMTSYSHLEYLGFPLVATYSDYRSDIENQLELMDFIASFFDKRDLVAEKLSKIRQTFVEIEEKAKYHPKPKLTWGVYYGKRVFTLSKNFWLTEILNLAGADYVFNDIEFDNRDFSLEEFITRSRDADIFFANPLTEAAAIAKEDMTKWHEDLLELKPFTGKGTVALTEPILWQDPWNLDEIALDMAALIHPELYPGRTLKYVRILKEGED